ncbi:MAG: hypothetical protein SLAVMIC_00531 [uncultured marine phage]|uniref:Uncharacterized protein n=1 Tax=uncultured marine phage TaxID=707152 RepID=A0A8D9C932_9VIRU|nr:MAG: hypothetical protein SLAVMIC_00531 [uncultured marine phage]
MITKKIIFHKNGTHNIKIVEYPDYLPNISKRSNRELSRHIIGNTYYTIEQEVIIRNWRTLFLTKTTKFKQPFKDQDWVIPNSRKVAEETLEFVKSKYISVNRENRLKKLLYEN